MLQQHSYYEIAMTDKKRSDRLCVEAKEITAEEFKTTGRKVVISKKKRVSIFGFRDNCPSYEVDNEEINGDGDASPQDTLRCPSNVSTHETRPSFLITFLLSWLQPTRVGIEQSRHTAGMKYDENAATKKRYMTEDTTPTSPTFGVFQSEKTTNNMITKMISGSIASFLSLKTPSHFSPKVKPIKPISAPVVNPTIYNHIPDLSTRSFHGSDPDSCVTTDKYLPFSRQCSVEQELFKLESG